MKTLRILFCILPLFFAGTPMGLGCSCFGPDTFCATIEGQADNPSLLVIKGKKIADIAHGMNVQVLEVLQGEEDQPVIRVWGDNGFLCRVYPSTFGIGEEFIFALLRIEEDPSGENLPDWLMMEQKDDYIISVCGRYYFPCSNWDDPSQNPPTACLDNPCHCTPKPALFYPNPAREKVYFNLPADRTDIKGSIEIFDTSGNRVGNRRAITKPITDGRVELDVTHLIPGVYLVKVYAGAYCGGAVMGKVVVM